MGVSALIFVVCTVGGEWNSIDPHEEWRGHAFLGLLLGLNHRCKHTTTICIHHGIRFKRQHYEESYYDDAMKPQFRCLGKLGPAGPAS